MEITARASARSRWIVARRYPIPALQPGKRHTFAYWKLLNLTCSDGFLKSVETMKRRKLFIACMERIESLQNKNIRKCIELLRASPCSAAEGSAISGRRMR